VKNKHYAVLSARAKVVTSSSKMNTCLHWCS